MAVGQAMKMLDVTAPSLASQLPQGWSAPGLYTPPVGASLLAKNFGLGDVITDAIASKPAPATFICGQENQA
jgi:hypothetical protein